MIREKVSLLFQERIKELFDTLNASNQEIARCADCTPSSISRLRSGARKPSPQSPTVDKLVTGVIHYATLHGKMSELDTLIGECASDEQLDTAIRKWLYADEKETDYVIGSDGEISTPFPTFGEKLNMIMLLTNLSNIRLSRLVNVDSSYISRFRNGIRTPKSNPELFDRICQTLFEQLDAMEALPELGRMMNTSFDAFMNQDGIINRGELYLHFHAWMGDFSSADHATIRHLLGTIDTFSPNLNITIPPLEDIISDDIYEGSDVEYRGITGLQNAVLRFLGHAVREHYEELLLYSDQGMEWLVSDPSFLAKWSALMALSTRQGTRIKIIHNIDRDIMEMIEAVESWLPLYVSGMVESFYSRKNNGNRFRHTIFLCPGKACIAACHPVNMDNQSIYGYFTEPSHLEFFMQSFQCLMDDCAPLVNIHHGVFAENDEEIISRESFNNLSLSITQNRVTIIKNNAPNLTLSFTHPLLCNAFQMYVESEQEEGQKN